MKEPVIKVILYNFTPIGLTKEEFRWLIDHMDWSIRTLDKHFTEVSFYIPV